MTGKTGGEPKVEDLGEGVAITHDGKLITRVTYPGGTTYERQPEEKKTGGQTGTEPMVLKIFIYVRFFLLLIIVLIVIYYVWKRIPVWSSRT